ncbi:AMP-binding protein [Saccharothrix texasensis]|uniref:Acyl-CoA synthetase (AMP-forming)/AMP-acid ligase II n=1 Tax=Saccharothrix texasensis TaxID=103734 RepID=A0A3N1GXE9_9PSEU|nr:AMP-binding protein [Saccharothrix texasensis]ROP34934.1 acyl-CoA synthetase (AMP-forming)/AMP-acid ligase II [Saccharothrix texasensis]
MDELAGVVLGRAHAWAGSTFGLTRRDAACREVDALLGPVLSDEPQPVLVSLPFSATFIRVVETLVARGCPVVVGNPVNPALLDGSLAAAAGAGWRIHSPGPGADGEPRAALTRLDTRHDRPDLSAALIFPTSGTTGHAKLVTRTLSSISAEVERYRDYYARLGVHEGSRLTVLCSPLHTYGFFGGIVMSMDLGCAVGIPARHSLDGYRDALAADATVLLIPDQFRLVAAALPPSAEVVLVSAGSRLGEDHVRVVDAHPGVQICQLFGTTETGFVTGAQPTDPILSVGPPTARTRISDDGVLEVDTGSSPYLGGAARASTGAHWHSTGDLARVEGGLLHIEGRRDLVINVEGRKVDLEQVESVVEALPEVRAALARARGAAGYVLLVEGSAGRDAIEARLRSVAPDYMLPRDILFAEVPRTPSGKKRRAPQD